jgi:hypothetical protein
MRLFHSLACSLTLSLFIPAFAQSAQQPAPPQTPAAQPSTAAQQAAPAQSAAPTLQLRDLPPDPHTPTPEELAAQKAAQVRMALTRLATEEANWGPAESTPGMSMELKETGRKNTANGTEITWQITGKGFTPDMQLTLVRWPLNQNATGVMSGIVMNATGTAVCGSAALGPQAPTEATATTDAQVPSCAKTIAAGSPITLTSTAAKGEAVRVALISADRKHGAAVSFVPFPIEGEDKGCHIQVIRGSKDNELVLVEGDGFKKDATYTLGTESYGDKRPLAVTINAQGRFIGAVTPWVPNHDSGDTVVYYQSSTCTPTVSFHWGKDTYKPE